MKKHDSIALLVLAGIFCILNVTALAQTDGTMTRAQAPKSSTTPVPDCASNQNCDDKLSFSWGEITKSADGLSTVTSSQGPYQLTAAGFKSAKSEVFTMCNSSSCGITESAKKTAGSLAASSPQTIAPSGAGEVTLYFSNPGGTNSGSSGCPINALVDGAPIKGVIVKGGRNPGGSYTLDNAIVAHCNASSIAISYQRMAINTKGTGGNNGHAKGSAN